MLATAPSAVLVGVDGHPVTVEVHVSNGLPGFTVVGQPDTSCRESRDRVRAALLSSGLAWPQRRVTVNLAPSEVRKHGAGLDLAIAVALLVADGQLPAEAVAGKAFLGELGLDGSLRPVAGAIGMAAVLPAEEVVVPPANAAEVGLVARHVVRAPATLAELVGALRGEHPWPEPPRPGEAPPTPPEPDLADVRGQPVARRALEVAAAGGHHLLMVGPPGAGKTLLAERLPGLLPCLPRDRALEVTRVHSAAGLPLPPGGLVERPPFRAPHHTASTVALVGGGSAAVRPGEISLAHGGVLFLDELGEFPAAVLDALRQPLEAGRVHLARAGVRTVLPARVLLVAAMNPCPCGERGSPDSCRCSDLQLARYRRRLSTPLLDRFDLRIEVTRPDGRALLAAEPGESSAAVRARVEAARAVAAERGVSCNAELTAEQLDRVAPLAPDARELAERWLAQGRLTGRGLQRLRRVARTLADLEGRGGPIDAAALATAGALRVDPSFVVPRMAG
jgi:magnesium chelatase family protein